MRRLTLIRHGLTEGNVRGGIMGRSIFLCARPDKQLFRRPPQAGLYPPYSGERILTSGMLRTEQTLRLIYGRGAARDLAGAA